MIFCESSFLIEYFRVQIVCDNSDTCKHISLAAQIISVTVELSWVMCHRRENKSA